jgi:hypothetical protein
MTAVTNIPGANQFVLQEAISAYSDEAYTNAKKLSGTGIVGGNPLIQTDTETYIGQIRWFKPLTPTINVASLTDATPGTATTYASAFLRYVKTVRTHGAQKVNLSQIVTQQDGLAKIGRDFGETKAQDEQNALQAVIKGVAISEALRGAGAASGGAGLGGQTFYNDPTNGAYGFYVDMGASPLVTAAAPGNIGAARAEGFLNAVGMAYKDYEPPYMYLVVDPATLASLRASNLIDVESVTDGTVEFNTIFSGKFRLIVSRMTTSFTTPEMTMINSGPGVDIVGTKITYAILPEAIAMAALDVPDECEITRYGEQYRGGGVTNIWYRWGYVAHPAGYDWAGSQQAFPSDLDYASVQEGGVQKALTSVTATANATGSWNRAASSALTLGILPIFHS